MKARHFVTASMFGYSLASETSANLKTLSARRATSVENYLRDVLVALHVQPVSMHSTGEGSVQSSTNTAFRRVEIFLTL
jgi:flagellar motor protein MotB